MAIVKGVLTITPDDIKITKHMFDAFGHYETEVSAEWLVKFAQKRGQRMGAIYAAGNRGFLQLKGTYWFRLQPPD